MLSRWRNCCDLHVTPWTTSPTQRTTILWTTLTPESHVEPVAQLLRSPRDPMDNITNPADNNFEDNTNGFALTPYTEQRRAPSGVLAQQTMQRFGNAYFMGNSNNSTNNITTSSAYSMGPIRRRTVAGPATARHIGHKSNRHSWWTALDKFDNLADGILLDCDTNRILSDGGGVDFRSANAPPLKTDEFERRDTQHQSFPAANNGRIVPSKKSGKKNMRKERGTTINVKELAEFFMEKIIPVDLNPNLFKRTFKLSRTAPKKEKNGTDANVVVVAAAVGDASAAVPVPPPEQKPQQQQPEITADNNEPSTKKGKQTKHVSSTAHRRTLTKQQRRRQQQQQLATQSRGSSAEDVEGGGGGGGVADVKPDQNIDPTLNAETVAEAAASEVRNSLEKTKKPLLERIPSNVLRQLREKKAWHCPFTICNPFMNTGATAAVDRENVMKGPVEPWLERSDAFPLPAQLLQHGPMPMSKNGDNVNVPTTL
ncbi:hypothetical protein niasHS_000146 [Heterodera schachtii]|uniref:Uncharacterized protein n=1 Tax=Heterodera schachtii TaxID=97005 RepID=A0ABD2KNK3_HETSC